MNTNQFLAFDKYQNKFINNVVITPNGFPHITRITDELNNLINEYYKSLGDLLYSDCDVIDYTDYYAIENIVICQFTGFIDIDGQPIYENQILNVLGSEAVVVFENGKFNLKFIESKVVYGVWLLKDFHCSNYKIVGNIFECIKK